MRWAPLRFAVIARGPGGAVGTGGSHARRGSSSKHAVTLAWAPEYEQGLQYIDEPYIANMREHYELFGGISVMQMTVNHVHTVIRTRHDPGPARRAPRLPPAFAGHVSAPFAH